MSGFLFGAAVKPVSDFIPRVMPYLPGCPVPMAAQAIVDAAIQFCESSMAVRQHLDPIVLVPGQRTYDLDTPLQQEVARVMRAAVDGAEISLTPLAFAPMGTPSQGRPFSLTVTRLDSYPEIQLAPIPDASYTLTVDAALRPTRTATNLADDLWTLWLDAIVAGAVSAVQRIPSQPFSDPTGAAQRHAEFRSHISRARVDASMGKVQSALRVKARPFA